MGLLTKAFTIIEVIFIIVILTILAAVAVPKLQETEAKAAYGETTKQNKTEWGYGNEHSN